MAFLTDWVSNIVLIILLGVMVDMLIPNNSFQKYIRMVVGLLLILAILTPLLKAAGLNPIQYVENLKMDDTVQGNDIKNSMELRKREIEKSQDAYIFKQMRVHMKNEVKEELKAAYGVTIVRLALKTKKEGLAGARRLSPEAITAVDVTLGQVTEEKGDIPAVENVDIQAGGQKADEAPKNEQSAIRAFLAAKWNLKLEDIRLYKEGEEGGHSEEP